MRVVVTHPFANITCIYPTKSSNGLCWFDYYDDTNTLIYKNRFKNYSESFDDFCKHYKK